MVPVVLVLLCFDSKGRTHQPYGQERGNRQSGRHHDRSFLVVR
jgi:hypothetical protein